MKTTPDNKMVGRCPRCGRSDRHCRQTASGFWCQQWGLTYDQGALIAPDADPVDQAVTADPQVQATALVEREAQAAFEAASATWETAAAQLAEVRLKAARDKGSFSPFDGGWRPSAQVRKLARRERELIGDVERLWKAREVAGEQLRAARVAHACAADTARLRAGGSVLPSNQPPGTGASTIPTY